MEKQHAMIPPELLSEILSFSIGTPKELDSISRVCRGFRYASHIATLSVCTKCRDDPSETKWFIGTREEIKLLVCEQRIKWDMEFQRNAHRWIRQDERAQAGVSFTMTLLSTTAMFAWFGIRIIQKAPDPYVGYILLCIAAIFNSTALIIALALIDAMPYRRALCKLSFWKVDLRSRRKPITALGFALAFSVVIFEIALPFGKTKVPPQ